MKLNKEQAAAVGSDSGPILVLAGAGSGKTRVLTERIVHIIESGMAKPYEILAVTFTNKAANEMARRVEASIGASARDILISTFHSACLRFLRRNASAAGLPDTFAIYDDSDQLSLLKKILIDLNIGDKLITPRGACEKISRAKDSLITPDNYPDGDFYNAKVAAVYQRYQEELSKAGAVDFGDLIMKAILLFRGNTDIRSHYQTRFKYLLVDEYQDTNHAQYELIKLLAEKNKNVFVVGDPDQSIYAWRGADISNILEFERDFEGARVIKLEQNYRSTKNILAASDAVIANNESRRPKTLWTENPDGDLIKIIEANDERREAALVMTELDKLRTTGLRLRDMAVFYRTNAQSRIFEDELRKEGIPYVIYGGTRFYDRAEIKDILAYLKLINNPGDDVSLRRILNVPARGIGKTTADKLLNEAAVQKISVFQLITTNLRSVELNGSAFRKVSSFASLISGLIEIKERALSELVTELIKRTSFRAALAAERTDEAEARVENVDEFISAVTEANATLPGFLDQVALISSIDRFNETDDYLPLMTLHLAKGLEFPAVFIVGLEEGLLPHIRSIDENADIEEERRLFYVGMTRAKKTLYICHANERLIRGNYSYNIRSRFLEEIPELYTEKIYGSEKRPRPPAWQKQPSSRTTPDNEFSQIQGEDHDNFTQIADYLNKYSFSQTRSDAHEGPSGFRVGQRVKHPTFGEGIVRKAEGPANKQRLIVQFRSGELKKLSTEFARLISI